MSKTPKFSSSFWLGNRPFNFGSVAKADTTSVYELASHKRAIGNFVTIVTGQKIPVEFAGSGDSYTDGKRVTISSKLDSAEEFDVAVGLSLHEGSHIKLSDFNILREMAQKINFDLGTTYIDKAFKAGINAQTLHYTAKSILNVIEDRRIDQYIFDSAPGYRDYYRAMYDKYFNDPIADKALKSDEHTSETLEAYMFRIINLHSEYSRLNALKALPAIYNLIDLKNINRLKTTEAAYDVTVLVLRVLIDALEEAKSDNSEFQPNESQSGSGEASDEKSDGQGGDSDGDDDSDEDDSDGQGGDSDGDESDSDSDGQGGDSEGDEESDESGSSSKSSSASAESSNGKPVKSDSKLSQNQKRMLKRLIQKQQKFLDGNVSKEKLDSSTKKSVERLEEAETRLEEVGKSYDYRGINCVVVKNMTESLIKSKEFPIGGFASNSATETVNKGIRYGTLIGKKLQLRSESRDTIFNRLNSGKIDRRMIPSLGYGNEQVFYTKATDAYKKANLHISIDASSSMRGGKWDSAMITSVALAKAVDMIPNLEIQISFRAVQDGLPWVVIAYDSRKDKFTKVKKLFPYLSPTATTPEGLCFEAITKELVPTSTEIDSYFVNVSDGQPYFHSSISYSGEAAAKHTYEQVKKIAGMGIGILSYFVGDGGYSSATDRKIFTESYKAYASFVDVENMNNIVKTMNKLFMKK